jgi:hypothetical protein
MKVARRLKASAAENSDPQNPNRPIHRWEAFLSGGRAGGQEFGLEHEL